MDKKEELLNLKNDDFIKESNYRLDGLTSLCKIIADKDITNWNRTYTDMILSEDKRKLIFKWLNKQVEEKTKEKTDNNLGWGHVYSKMSISWYLFDKPKFWRYIDSVMKLKKNVHTIDWETKEIKSSKTCRLKELEKLLPFLAEEGYWDDLEKILKMYSETKQTKSEYKETIKSSITWASFHYARTPEDRDNGKLYGNRDSKNKISDRYYKLLDKYLVEPKKIIKENFILNWDNFKRL